jgi:hypothetical protein
MQLLEDHRMGGMVSYVLTRRKRLMRVPDEIRKCVGFIGHKWPDGRSTFHGTFFFVSVAMDADYNVAYGVTAAHVLNGMRTAGISPMLRLNALKGNKATWIRTSHEDWLIAEEPAHDTAIIRLPLGSQKWDYRALPTDTFLTGERESDFEVGPGHEVFIPGLFVMFDDPYRVYGAERNIPIVRAGHIAAMLGERVPTKLGMMDAYLVEARSIGGLSGSPVFVHLGSVWVRDGHVQVAHAADGTPRDSGIFFLMGLVHGHFPMLATTSIDAAIGSDQRDVNMGISIVAPIANLQELLERDDIKKAREDEFAAWQVRKTAVPDASEP